ncbi:MAG: hypothetical protein A2176_12920 [Spirochaetes bacterium RBG_13_51_14]|nr:MAG: hypothetical protein A2176_12920 [Spirochaetes bacterium RBG_13_51_14]
MKLQRTAILVAVALLCSGLAYGQIEDLADKETGAQAGGEKEKDITFALHGYAQANVVVTRNDIGVKGNKWLNSKYEFPRIGSTLQLELEGNAYDVAHFFSAVQIEYNAAGEKTNFPTFYYPNAFIKYTYFTYDADFNRGEINKYPTINVRETYVDLYGKSVNFRVGQQIISWGEIEGVEAPSDVVIPWDFTTMSNYFEYSRIGVVAANLNFYFAKQQLQLIWMPLFQPAKLPLESVFRRGVTSIKRPAFEARNGEYAARLSGALGNRFRYGLGFLYCYDDLPDARVKMVGPVPFPPIPGPIPIPVFIPTLVITEMYYNRVYIPTLDLGIQMGEVLSWKVSGNANITKDFRGKSDLMKNSTVTYLTGPESSNIFAKIYLGLYVGQQWVINYTKPSNDTNPIELLTRIDQFKLPNSKMFKGYGQLYPYRWMLSGNIQRTFLEGDTLEFQARVALYADPKFKKVDYVIYPYFMFKFTNGVSTAVGFVFAKRQGDDRNMIISETRYSF